MDKDKKRGSIIPRSYEIFRGSSYYYKISNAFIPYLILKFLHLLFTQIDCHLWKEFEVYLGKLTTNVFDNSLEMFQIMRLEMCMRFQIP